MAEEKDFKDFNVKRSLGRYPTTFSQIFTYLYIENRIYLHIEIDSVFYRNIILSLPFLPLLFPP